MKRIAGLAVLFALAPAARADEGMWTFNNFPKDKVKQKLGVEATPAWLDHVRLSAAKFGGGCSASFVSADGLVMTNHHCARSCVQEVSTAKNDYMKNGFAAKTQADELRCPALDIRQLSGIEDVTARLNAATKGLTDQKYNEALKAEMSRIEKECTGDGKTVQCDVVTLYNGGVYNLYKYRKWTDVRLAFAPEAQMAFFGGDPDNFMFPRWDLDVSFVRVYEDGKPAHTEQHYGWSAAGAKEGEATFVVGHPGSTERLATVAQLEYVRDVSHPASLKMLAELRGILTEFQRRGPEQKRISQTMLFGVENNFKRLTGMHEALLDGRFFAQKAAEENALRAKVAKDPKKKKLYGAAWDAVAKAIAEQRKIGKAYSFIEGGGGFRSSLFSIARTLVRGADERGKPDGERLREFRDAGARGLEARLFSTAPVYKELEEVTLSFSLTKLRENLGTDHPFVRKVLGKASPDELAHALLTGSKLDDVALRKKLWEGGRAAVDASDDPMIKMARLVDADARAMRKRYEDDVEAPEKKNEELIAKARFEVLGTGTYPDATGTLRVSYGAVRGYDENGRHVEPFTKIGGAFDRATGREPFALPASWLKAKKLNPETPFNFVTDNDIIGGNSGSPVINKDAQIVGLVFDGNIQSLGGAYFFDGGVNRTVALHSSAIIEALRNVYGADRLADELNPPRAAAAGGP